MFAKRIAAIVAAAALLVSLAACGHSSSSAPNASPGKTKAYANDGMLGTSQSNPNLPTNETYHTYTADTQLIKDTLARISGIRKSTIVLNGPNVFVTLDLEDATPIEEAMRIKADAQQQVSRMMPRYNVKVRVNKSGVFQR
ncbi:MAG: hypothetical protein J7639_25380 [Paenibacillaceae bacterium]|nr:hypothetical protein [Paenibacillaceae bacterium]